MAKSQQREAPAPDQQPLREAPQVLPIITPKGRAYNARAHKCISNLLSLVRGDESEKKPKAVSPRLYI